MITALLIVSAFVNFALAYELYRVIRKFRITAWREQIVRESLQQQYNEGIDSPAGIRVMRAMKEGRI